MMPERVCEGIWLSELLEGIGVLSPSLDRRIDHLALHSNDVYAGACFIAYPGLRRDGRDYIADALRAGAVAVVAEGEVDAVEYASNTPVIKVPRLGEQVSEIAARFYARPAQQLKVIGITGTNGKTSVAGMLAQTLNDDRKYGPCGLAGTLGSGRVGKLIPTSTTTPDPIAVQRLLAELRDNQARSAVLEVSSHALVQHRVTAVQFDTAVFTNLGRDHLDYHLTVEAYRSAKKQLFQFSDLRNAVVNADDALGQEIIAECKVEQLVAYSLHSDIKRAPGTRYFVARDIRASLDGLSMVIESPGITVKVNSPLIGQVNAPNLLASFATLTALGLDPDQSAAALAQTTPVTGRMQRFGGKQGQPLVVVDYAHTPEALQLVLRDLRALSTGTLWCVFGCGGERDAGKRPLMGEVAAELADHIILTTDNPRSETARDIVDDILHGISAHSHVIVEADRAKAVTQAVTDASSDDVVLIAGKGHETFQQIDGQHLPVSDQLLVRNALQVKQA